MVAERLINVWSLLGSFPGRLACALYRARIGGSVTSDLWLRAYRVAGQARRLW